MSVVVDRYVVLVVVCVVWGGGGGAGGGGGGGGCVCVCIMIVPACESLSGVTHGDKIVMKQSEPNYSFGG